MVQTLRCIIYC